MEQQLLKGDCDVGGKKKMKKKFIAVSAAVLIGLVASCDEAEIAAVRRLAASPAASATIPPPAGQIQTGVIPTPTPRPTPTPTPTLAPLPPTPAVAMSPLPPVNEQPVATGSQQF